MNTKRGGGMNSLYLRTILPIFEDYIVHQTRDRLVVRPSFSFRSLRNDLCITYIF